MEKYKDMMINIISVTDLPVFIFHASEILVVIKEIIYVGSDTRVEPVAMAGVVKWLNLVSALN